MNLWLKYVICAVAGYLLGTISLGIFVARLYGIKDIRKVGSGNAGTTNVLRNLGWMPSVLTLVGDCLKGLVAALIGKWIAGDMGLIIGGVAAVLGHDFPVFFRFKGGKGVATNLGMILAFNPLIALILTPVVILVVAITHYMSVGSIMACFAYPALVVLLQRGKPFYGAYIIAACLMGLLALWCHRANLMRLIRGQENRLDFARISALHSKMKIGKK